MKKLLAPLFMVLCAFTIKGDEWKTITLMPNITVNMPANVAEDNSKGVPMQKATLEDGTEFMAFAVDYSQFGMTAEQLQAAAGTDEFKQMLEMQASAQPGVKILKNELGKYNDKYTSYEITADVDKDGYKGTMNNRTVFFKSYGISMIYKPGKKGADNAIRDKVFNSLKITE